jgi:hypothetical protein
VAQHVDVHREWQFRRLAGTLDHPGDAYAPEWLAPFIDEHIRRFNRLLALQPLQSGKLVTLQIVR